MKSKWMRALVVLFALSASGTAVENRKIEIDTTEGTWMSLDVSPDGKQIVFDLLGDIYVVPIRGGEAKRLTSLPKVMTAGDADLPNRGQSFDSQPRFSPDGRWIVFVSDRDGADNIFVMNADGSGVRQLTTGRDGFISPAWSPDGRFIAVRRRMQTRNEDNGSGLWMYGIEGGAGYRIDTGKFKSPSGFEFARDGSAIYFAGPIGSGSAMCQIARKQRESGTMTQITQNFGGAVRPRISPDGRWMAYATFDDGQTVLRLLDLRTGADRLLLRGIEQDVQLRANNQLDLLPNYAFAPDGRAIYLSYAGKIHRVSVETAKVEDVPFHVKTTLDVGPLNRATLRPVEGKFRVRMLQWTQLTPNRRSIVFEAVGKIWIADADGQHARRITNSTEREYQPSVSPDGRWIAYVTWTDAHRGQLRKISIEGGAPVTLTQESGLYINPNWSPDAKRIVVVVGGGAELQEQEATHDLSRMVSWVSSDGGELHEVAPLSFAYVPGNNVHLHASVDIGGRFNRDGTRIWYMDGPELHSVRLDGSDDRTHLKLAVTSPFDIEDPPMFVPSPDESQVVFTAGNNDVWLMPMPWTTAEPIKVDIKSKSTPGLKRISKLGGFFPTWIDNDELSFTFAGKFYRYRTSSSSTVETAINLSAEVPAGTGTLALRGARVITMSGDQVIERGTIVVRDNRIVEVGATDKVRIPAEATVLDVRGKTIMPGIIDAHDHLLMGSSIRIWPEQDRFMMTALSYGVTTIRDPAASNLGGIYFAELINTGQMLGPRAYTTGEHLLPPLVEIHNFADAMHTVELQKELGAVALKEYEQPTRWQRQLMAEAARKQGMIITAEGDIDFKNNMGMLIDGYNATEHLWAYHPLYGDVAQLMAKTGFYYTPTFGTSAAGSEHWYRQMDVENDPKQTKFLLHSSREHLWRRITGQKIAPEWIPVYISAVTSANRMFQAGAKLAVGSHDEPTPTGLGTHWEMWSYIDGGMTPLQALRCGTLGSAEAMGMDKDLGSIEKGKLADLVILNANPLKDIKNTIKIDRLLLNGIVYSGADLEQSWPSKRKSATLDVAD